MIRRVRDTVATFVAVAMLHRLIVDLARLWLSVRGRKALKAQIDQQLAWTQRRAHA